MPDASDLDNPAAFIDRIIGGDTDAVDDPIAQIQKLDPGTPPTED
ncbi:putative hydrolase [Mycobacteroides abscessus subsp. abscessus]|nr:putative hydrolase [Mycobacteroides abscessus subsp. abscessus]SHT08947.1 putative hydrolase [Mycobacteroides abscessus subsp. abscessus]SHW31191.1 putative hydrolase [Mycobacteroides abscessus subsp. abscessus]SKP68382.1 putative hydrolase [Mycobacteroides abscessus subsp. abscessus]